MPEFTQISPILRILDEDKAREFYIGYLGFELVFEHRFADNMPLYMGAKLGNFELHLSEHHGDANPGGAVYLEMKGLREYHASLAAKNYKYLRPGIGDSGFGTLCMDITDPFGNRLSFNESPGD